MFVRKASSYVNLEKAELETTAQQLVEKQPHGTLEVAARCIAELRFNALLTMTLYAVVGETRRVIDEEACDSRPAGQCLEDCMSQVQRSFGLSLSWESDLPMVSVVGLLAALNSLAFGWICMRAASKPEWRDSDLALCFHLNADYSLQPVKALRLFNAGVTLACILMCVAVASKSSSAIAVLTEEAVPFVLAIMAAYNLHAPSTAFDMPFDVFGAHVRGASFGWGELLQPAPAVLQARISAAAMDALKADAVKAHKVAEPSPSRKAKSWLAGFR